MPQPLVTPPTVLPKPHPQGPAPSSSPTLFPRPRPLRPDGLHYHLTPRLRPLTPRPEPASAAFLTTSACVLFTVVGFRGRPRIELLCEAAPGQDDPRPGSRNCASTLREKGPQGRAGQRPRSPRPHEGAGRRAVRLAGGQEGASRGSRRLGAAGRICWHSGGESWA